MDPQDIAVAMTAALEAGDFERAASYLADDFQFSTPQLPQPLGKKEWLGLSRALKEGIPDLNYNFRILGTEGNRVRVSSQLTGTHTGNLDLSGMGMGVIPPTGRSFSAPQEESEGMVEGGRVKWIYLHSTPETGLAAMLSQLGIEMPM